jgi:hypothetical protein
MRHQNRTPHEPGPDHERIDRDRPSQTLALNPRALALTEATLGSDHPGTTTLRQNLAYLLELHERQAHQILGRPRCRRCCPWRRAPCATGP